MKRTTLLLTVALISLTASAQQALWGGGNIVSPEIHQDYSVTFRLRAPKASVVELTGDFLPTQKIEIPASDNRPAMTYDAPGRVQMKEGQNGVWEYTTAPLSSELYSYNFVVNGLTIDDPSNPFCIRDVASVTDYFIIPGNLGDLYSVQNVPHGTVARRWYNSPTLGFDRRLTIYTPPGYETSKQSYPVFYLLHGAGGDEEAWIALGRTSQILDNLIAQGKAKPMIVVMTNGNGGQQAAPGEAPNSMGKPSMNAGRMMDGGFEMSFPEIVKFIDKSYRTIPKKTSRAIAGLSMGGFHSLHISKQFPDMFDYVGLFSAAIMPGQNRTSEVFQDMDGKLKVQFGKHPKLYWIAIGKTDFLYAANVDYRKKLDAAGYKYQYYESDGGHIWRNWRVYLSIFAPMLFK